MKKVLCLLCALIFLSLPAFASDAMRVVNCEEWVSLRAEPSRSSDRVAQVPLGAIVTQCVAREGEFTYCEYKGLSGFILSSYLENVYGSPEEDRIGSCLFTEEDVLSIGDPILDAAFGEYRVLAARGFVSGEDGEGGEYVRLGCFREGAPVWGYATHTNGIGQYDGICVLLSGTEDAPYVGIQNADVGFLALELEDGSSRFSLTMDDVSLGSLSCCATGADGTLYAAGADGPDPVAIAPDGKVLWRSDVGDPDIYWPYDMEAREDGILVRYDSPAEAGHPVVLFGYDGSVQWTSVEE